MLLAAPAMAQDAELPVAACAEAVGTFLLADPTDSDETASRTLLALTNGGHAMFIDSGQWGGDGYAPFSDGLGRWRCLSAAGDDPKLRAVILDFTNPDEGGRMIARVDLDGTVDRATGQFTATAKLSFFPLDSDPSSVPAPADAEQFALTGHKIVVPE